MWKKNPKSLRPDIIPNMEKGSNVLYVGIIAPYLLIKKEYVKSGKIRTGN